MAKRQMAKDQDKFIVRLPDGLRDRIKAKAERAGMSMNEAVVYVLEQQFPKPVTLEEKVRELASAVSVLKGDDTYREVDDLIEEIRIALWQVAEGRVTAFPAFQDELRRRQEQWSIEQLEEAVEREHNPFDPDKPVAAARNPLPSGDDPEFS